MILTTLFDEAKERKASDIHLASGETPRLRISGDLVALDQAKPLDRAALSAMLAPVFPLELQGRLQNGQPIEASIVHADLSFVGIAFRFGADGLAATFRVLGDNVPALDAIGGHALPLFREIAQAPRGLVIVSGPTGSGKTTTAWSIAQHINETRAARIFIVEGHPSYPFKSAKGLLTQLHVGQDCESYAQALDIAHQADLDVVAIDDIPTLDALRQVITLAETGHLVIANLHADSAVDAIQRLILSAGVDDAELRTALARTLIAVTGQRLLPRADRPGRVPAYDWLKVNAAVRPAVLSGDIARLAELEESDPDCRSLHASLTALVEAGEVTEAAADALRVLP